MASESQSGSRKLRRTANACIACRQSKIKCSGTDPCANCQRRVMKCRFVEGGNRVMVTERYLLELQQQARDLQRSPSKRSPEMAFGVATLAPSPDRDRAVDATIIPQVDLPAIPAIETTRSICTSPFTLPSRTIKNPRKDRRGWIWLAPTSVWSFTARLVVMMTERLNLDSPYNAANFLNRDVYPLRWRPAPPDDPPEISGLPSLDYAMYLFNTVKFHLGSYRLLDEESFLTDLQDFYHGNAVEKANECRLWFVQFLLVMAFGHAFLLQSRNTRDPPGSKYFVRAMSLMPDYASLWKDSLLAIEVLALAGLFLYSIDHRESAHVHVGQAIRIAQLEGLHTELPEEELGAVTVTRCRNLWWTLYILDRHFSSSLGLPMTIQDSDITTSWDPPSSCSQQDGTLSLQVRLSHLLSYILTSIYKTEETHLGTFLDKTRTILHTLAGHAQEIEGIIYTKFQNAVDTMPKGTQHVTLLYHQCVIVATRPLLLSILKERLDKLDQGEEDWQSFLAPTKTLISTGIKSAAKTLQILSDEGSLLDFFLPFDLEFTYGAAIHLAMANALFPHATDGQSCIQDAFSIFDEMTYKGNRLAAAQKSELVSLESLFCELASRIERRGLQTLSLTSPDQLIAAAEHLPADDPLVDAPPPDSDSLTLPLAEASPGIDHPASNMEFLENIGISSYEFLSIVDQIGNPETYSVLDHAPAWKDM